MFLDHDSFKAEYDQFRDVHMLIEGTLDASTRFLDTETKTELAKIEQWLKTPESIYNEYRDHWVDEHTDLLATNDGQELFLRSLAFVALASRLTHSLNKMARYAERFSERKSRYGGKERMDELEDFGLSTTSDSKSTLTIIGHVLLC
ncbi:MAG TPA: hypothetical protein VGO27_05885 [Candidatus Acidoferrum sp.]|nr:hypothetical protein [Candidatus Acidoferrum sp.]